nr:hypothetical protein [Tanacetum cinerariifolium]
KEKTGFHTEEGVYCFTHMPKELKSSAGTLQGIMEEVDLVQDVEETLRKLKRVNIKIDPVTSSFEVKEGRLLGFMVTKKGVRADPEKVHAIILNPTPKSPNQIRSLFLQLIAISKFIPKMAELQYPIRKVRMRFETTEGSGWTNEAEKALRRIKRKLNKLQNIGCSKGRKHKVKVITDGPMEEILKLSRKEGRLAKWATEIRTYDISYILGREAEGSVLKNFFGQGEQVEETETIKEGSGVGIILVSPEEKMYSYAIRLKFNASNHAMDCEALLTRLAVSVSKGTKDLHVLMDSPKLVAQTEGNNTPVTEQERKYKKEIMDATESVSGLNDKLSSSDASFAKSKAKGKERKKKIKSLTKSLDNLHTEVARLSAALNQATILEAEKDEEILRLRATPPEFSSFFRGQFQGLVQKFLASDEFIRVQGELFSLAVSAGFERGMSMHQTKDEFAAVLKKMANFIFEYATEPLSVILQLEPKKLAHPTNVPPSRDARVFPPITKESTVTPASKSLDLSTNVDLTPSVVSFEHNEEVGIFVALKDVVGLAEVGSGCASSGPNDVVVALFGERGGAPSMPKNTCCSKIREN